MASFALTNGRPTKGGEPTLDLCAPHIKRLHALFKPRRKEPDAEAQKYVSSKLIDFPAGEAQVLALAKKKPKFSGIDVVRVTNLTTYHARELIKRMVKAGKLKVHGKNRGKYLTA